MTNDIVTDLKKRGVSLTAKFPRQSAQRLVW
jgi:hypothetical protein